MKIQYSQSYHEDTGRDSVLEAIAKTRYALENAYAGFDDATDPDLIDCYIYEINSLFKRYRFLLHQAQELQLMPTADAEPAIPVMQDGSFAIYQESDHPVSHKHRTVEVTE